METVWIVLTQLVLLQTVTGDVVNIAQKKTANMSSYYGDGTLRADGAVDGHITTTYPNIVHTAVKQSFAGWKVDLLRDIQNATVRIYFRTDYEGRRNGVKLYTSTSPFPALNATSQGQLCHNVTGRKNGSDIPDVYNITCPSRWRHLLLYTDTDNDKFGPVLDFGEVEVWACSNGTYGEDCNKTCSSRNCFTMPTTCERDGICQDGCQSGWIGVDCIQACESGSYGSGCNLSCSNRHCYNASSPCDHVTGQCVGGCTPGYSGTDCRQPCESVSYGPDCNLSCSARNCSDASSPCDHVTGQCVGGCIPGYREADCRQQCAPDTYGVNCEKNCNFRHCMTSQNECDFQTGACFDGCETGWKGVDCSTSAKEHANIIIPAVGGGAAALVIIVIVIVVTVMYRRKSRQRTKTNESQPRKNKSMHMASNKALKTKEEISPDNVYVNVAMEPGDIINAEKPPEVTKKPQPAFAPKPSRDNDDQSEEILDEDEVQTSTPYYNIDEEDVIREVAVEDLAATVQKIKSRKGGFEAEYRRLPIGFTATYADSQKEENAGKNKFRGYYPYDYNRVRLSLIPDVPGSDYINASIMHNINETKTYIGAQAPKKKTLGDFWRMIWEQGCGRVVMLTGLVEDAREKCYQYWPEDDQLTTDLFRVSLEDTNTHANYTIRSMKVEKIEMGESRKIVQYHYTKWPDHGVPDTLALVNFIWMMRRNHTRTDGPLLVHCSAGIGRTGTYIAVDSLLDQAKEEGKVNVQGFMSIMRGQRKNMIQTVDQYECVFNCLVEMTTYGNTSLTVDDFTTLYINSGMDACVDSSGKTFRELAQMILAENNQCAPIKNRMWVDGIEEFTVRTAPSLRSVRGHLLCESAHPGKEKLLWKLVEKNNVNNVIVLDNTQNDLVGGKRSTKTFEEIKLTTEDQTKLTSDLSLAKLLLQIPIYQSEQKLQLLQFHEPVSVESLSDSFLEQSHLKLMTPELSSRVVVHGSTDRKVAVMFCMLGNLMSEIQEDETVDVLHQVRSFTRIFPDITLTQDDVKQLFNFVKRCAQLTASTYANM